MLGEPDRVEADLLSERNLINNRSKALSAIRARRRKRRRQIKKPVPHGRTIRQRVGDDKMKSVRGELIGINSVNELLYQSPKKGRPLITVAPAYPSRTFNYASMTFFHLL